MTSMSSTAPAVDRGGPIRQLVEEVISARAKAVDLPEPRERERIRVAAGVSARRAARALGVTAPAFLKWERGQSRPTSDRAARYRELLDALREAS